MKTFLIPFVFLLSGCFKDGSSGKKSHAIVELKPVSANGSEFHLQATFPLAIDNENISVVDSTVRLAINGTLIVDGKKVSYNSKPFPSEPKRENSDFIWVLPSTYLLDSDEVFFVATARDESGFASTDTVRFLDKCPVGGPYDDYSNPACPK